MILALLLAVAPVAHAADFSELRLGFSSGFESVTNDPFLKRTGVRLGTSIAPAPWVEFGPSFIFFPILGNGGENDPDWKTLSKQLLLESSVSPDISKIDWELQAVVRIRAVSYETGEWTFAIGALAGAAMVHTRDDPEALQVDQGDPAFSATANQVHFGPVEGLYWDALSGNFGLRFRAENVGYIETINSTTLEMKNNMVVGAEMLTWF